MPPAMHPKRTEVASLCSTISVAKSKIWTTAAPGGEGLAANAAPADKVSDLVGVGSAKLPGTPALALLFRHMGVPEELVKLFHTFSCGSTVCTVTVHGSALSIRLHRGVRQGGAESAVLYG